MREETGARESGRKKRIPRMAQRNPESRIQKTRKKFIYRKNEYQRHKKPFRDLKSSEKKKRIGRKGFHRGGKGVTKKAQKKKCTPDYIQKMKGDRRKGGPRLFCKQGGKKKK